MTLRLFLGGTRDGQWLSAKTHGGEETPEYLKLYAVPPLPAALCQADFTKGVSMTVTVETYVRMVLRGNALDPGHVLYCAESMGWAEIFTKLVEGYKKL